MARLIEVIETWEMRGIGTHADPCRQVRQLWSKDGVLEVEFDPCRPDPCTQREAVKQKDAEREP